ncbi:MAG: hypothetical protein EU549_01710 [Promethearchaeota archaeon]|nr:MAG: hypothetical protein EU549_01710 [Candidatus Lokiarchaeota archaeon]
MKTINRYLRVHIAAVGFEVDRVVDPILQMKADKVYIISKISDDRARPCVDEVLELLQDKLQLGENLIECKVEIYSLVENLNILARIFEKEDGNHIYVNCSGGSKIQGIAGMMACMMFDGFPYYVEPQEYLYIDEMHGPMTSGVKNILKLPDYKIEYPPEKLIDGLKILQKHPRGISKKNFIKELEEKELLTSTGKTLNSKYMLLKTNFITPMKNWNFINLEKLGRKFMVKITTDGKNALKIFSDKKNL